MKNQWNNITIDEFAQIRAVLTDKGTNQEEKMIRLAAIVKGVSEDTILNLPLTQAQEVFAQVWELNEMPHRNKVCKTYEIGGWKLHLTTKEKMSVAQWVDFQNYYREDFEGHLPEILSVALVPEGKKYNEGYDIGALIQTLRAFPVCDALAVCFFFSKEVSEINAAHPDLLGGVEQPEGEEGETDTPGSTPDQTPGIGYTTFAMIGEVVQFTRLNIDQVWAMAAQEFFAYVDFLIARNRRREMEIQKIKRS